jgi:hypothetical protein
MITGKQGLMSSGTWVKRRTLRAIGIGVYTRLDKLSLSTTSTPKFRRISSKPKFYVKTTVLGRIIQYDELPEALNDDEDPSWEEVQQGFEFLNRWDQAILLEQTFHIKRWCKQALLRCVEIWGYVEPDMLLRALNGNAQMRKTIAGLLGALNWREGQSSGCLRKDPDGCWRIADAEAFKQTLEDARLKPLSPQACAAAQQIAHQMRLSRRQDSV